MRNSRLLLPSEVKDLLFFILFHSDSFSYFLPFLIFIASVCFYSSALFLVYNHQPSMSLSSSPPQPVDRSCTSSEHLCLNLILADTHTHIHGVFLHMATHSDPNTPSVCTFKTHKCIHTHTRIIVSLSFHQQTIMRINQKYSVKLYFCFVSVFTQTHTYTHP